MSLNLMKLVADWATDCQDEPLNITINVQLKLHFDIDHQWLTSKCHKCDMWTKRWQVQKLSDRADDVLGQVGSKGEATYFRWPFVFWTGLSFCTISKTLVAVLVVASQSVLLLISATCLCHLCHFVNLYSHLFDNFSSMEYLIIVKSLLLTENMVIDTIWVLIWWVLMVKVSVWKWLVFISIMVFPSEFNFQVKFPTKSSPSRWLTFLWLWSHLNFFAGIFAKSSSKSSSESVEVESSFGWFHWIKIKWRIFWISKNKIVKTNKTDMNGRYDFVPPYFTFWLICWIVLNLSDCELNLNVKDTQIDRID